MSIGLNRISTRVCLKLGRTALLTGLVLLSTSISYSYEQDALPLLRTSTDGFSQLIPPLTTFDSFDLLIEKPGYVPVYLANTTLMTMPRVFPMRIFRTPTPAKFKGEMTEFGALPKDGILDIGIALPGLTKRSLARFQLADLINLDNDTLTVAGRSSEVPANISFPLQKESYFITLTFDKPQYRLTVPDYGVYPVASIHAKFPLKAAIDGMQSNVPFSGMINSMQFVEMGITTVAANQPELNVNLPVNQIQLDKSIPFTSGPFDTKKWSHLVLALTESSGRWLPTDMKMIGPQATINLKTSDALLTKSIFATLIRDTKIEPDSIGASAEALSLTLSSPNTTMAIGDLIVPNQPTYQPTSQTLEFFAPPLPTGLKPMGTYVAISLVEKITPAKAKPYEVKTLVWESYAQGWTSAMNLKSAPRPTLGANQTLRAEVIFAGQPASAPTPPAGPKLFEVGTHFARAAVELP